VDEMKLLICYDGSPDAKCAIERAGALFPGAEAVVLVVWEGFSEVLVRSGAGIAAAPLDFDGIDDASRASAAGYADEGVALAGSAGLNARPTVLERSSTVWETIIDQADELQGDAIVMGTRGLRGVRSMLMGSVSHAVLAHADRPVLIVPDAEVARARAQLRRGHRADSTIHGE
jgi:nucleotide-binding universal stress UspA family protein